MDRLIVLLLFAVGSAVYNWYTKKRDAADKENQGGAEAPRPATPPAQPAPRPAKSTSWEEELRKLLEGETPAAPPPRPRPVPPPVTILPAPRPAMLPPVRPVAQPAPRASVPPPVRRPSSSGRPAAPPPIRPATVRVPKPLIPLPVPTVTTLATRDMAPMAESRKAYAKAGQLDKDVAVHIAKVPTEHVKPTYVLRRQTLPEVVQMAALFKNARGARQAMIASVIFAPPRALEDAAWSR